jgi:hypothetical protein
MRRAWASRLLQHAASCIKWRQGQGGSGLLLKRTCACVKASSTTLHPCPRASPHTRDPQALESFVQRSPADARAQLDSVLAVALEALRHDPNFADDMQDDGEGGGGEGAFGAGARKACMLLVQLSCCWHSLHAARRAVAAVMEGSCREPVLCYVCNVDSDKPLYCWMDAGKASSSSTPPSAWSCLPPPLPCTHNVKTPPCPSVPPGGSDDDDDGGSEEYSDDEDVSWKVRR